MGFSLAIFRILRQRKEIAIRPSNGSTCILSTVQTFSTATTLNIPTFPSNGMDKYGCVYPFAACLGPPTHPPLSSLIQTDIEDRTMHTVRFAKVRRSSSSARRAVAGKQPQRVAGIWHLIRSGEDAREGAPESSSSSQSMTIRVMSSSCKRPEDRADQWAISPRSASASAAPVRQGWDSRNCLQRARPNSSPAAFLDSGRPVRVKHIAIAGSERDFE